MTSKERKAAARAAALEMNRARWARTTKAERSESARRAARARWARHKRIRAA